MQDYYPCCVLSGRVVPLISSPLPIPCHSLPALSREGAFLCTLPASALRNWRGQAILLSVGTEVLCPWNLGVKGPSSAVRRSLSVVLCYGSPDRVISLEM